MTTVPLSANLYLKCVLSYEQLKVHTHNGQTVNDNRLLTHNLCSHQSGRQPQPLQQLAQNSWNLVNACQLPYVPPIVPTQDQPMKSNMLLNQAHKTPSF